MQPILVSAIRFLMRLLYQGVVARNRGSVRFQRRWVQLMSASTMQAPDTKITGSFAGIDARLIDRKGQKDPHRLLYFHGGGYFLGSPETHKSITSHLASMSHSRVVAPDYRLAPEHPYPAALEDALVAYKNLLKSHPPGRIAIGGDSAGGGLALCLAIALRDQGLPLPASLALISPWTDLASTGDSIQTKSDAEVLLTPALSERSADLYRGDLSRDDPRISPLYANLSGLPPTYIQVGSEEILLDDSLRLDQKLRRAGSKVTLDVENGFWHDYQIHAGLLETSDNALARIAEFLQQHWSN